MTPKRIKPRDEARFAVAAALRSGAPFGYDHQKLVIYGAGNCTAPVVVTTEYRDPSPQVDIGTYPLFIDRHVRCRKCSRCLQSKANYWAARARIETLASARTWFVTLTVAPQQRHQYISSARVHLSRHGIDFDELSLYEQYQELANRVGKEATMWLKSVRKGRKKSPLLSERDPVSFRYMLAFEPHKDGFPHVHALMHEKNAGDLTERRIRRFWSRNGPISQAKLVPKLDTATPWYVCKYINKYHGARVRASRDYGVEPSTG